MTSENTTPNSTNSTNTINMPVEFASSMMRMMAGNAAAAAPPAAAMMGGMSIEKIVFCNSFNFFQTCLNDFIAGRKTLLAANWITGPSRLQKHSVEAALCCAIS